MNIKKLLNQELYVVVSNVTQIPYLINGEFFMVYTEKENAIKFAQYINVRESAKYGEASVISTSRITDNKKFFDGMSHIGYTSFLLNGSGEIINYDESGTKITDAFKGIVVDYLMHKKLSESSHIGKMKAARIAQLAKGLNAASNKKNVDKIKKMIYQIHSSFEIIDSGKVSTPVRISKADTIVNGIKLDEYNKKMTYGKLSRNWGMASIFLYAWIFPPIVAIVYGVRSILFTDSINEPIDKKAIWGLALSGFGLFMFYAANLGGLFNG